MKIKVALIQFSVVPGQVELNERTVEQMIARAAEQNAQIAVLPELWNCGYDLGNLPNLAQNLHGSSVSLLRRLSKEYHMFIFGGSVAERRQGKYFNTAVVIDQQGFLVGKYRKVHLFPLHLQENKYFTGGGRWGLVETPWETAGIALCYDIRFPELIRNLALRNARFVVIPAQWPLARVDHWVTLCRARAIENQIYIIAANRTGRDGTGTYPGKSLIISPWGKIIAEAGEQPDVITAEIELEEINRVRETIPVFPDRRPLLDEIDNSQL